MQLGTLYAIKEVLQFIVETTGRAHNVSPKASLCTFEL